MIQERNSANEVTAQLVRDGNISGILSRRTAAGATFYGYDGNGNVTLLTDAAGADVGRYRYDAWGNTLEITGEIGGHNTYSKSSNWDCVPHFCPMKAPFMKRAQWRTLEVAALKLARRENGCFSISRFYRGKRAMVTTPPPRFRGVPEN